MKVTKNQYMTEKQFKSWAHDIWKAYTAESEKSNNLVVHNHNNSTIITNARTGKTAVAKLNKYDIEKGLCTIGDIEHLGKIIAYAKYTGRSIPVVLKTKRVKAQDLKRGDKIIKDNNLYTYVGVEYDLKNDISILMIFTKDADTEHCFSLDLWPNAGVNLVVE